MEVGAGGKASYKKEIHTSQKPFVGFPSTWGAGLHAEQTLKTSTSVSSVGLPVALFFVAPQSPTRHRARLCVMSPFVLTVAPSSTGCFGF
ncbi:hypothetical protein E2320_007188 [Naja naja]|nr:hypothetical protein E2320_007188 [Naja naja]